MRLRKIKMAGFKSFVDPTGIDFPSDLVGVVGPNGCGKSNIIDAVRWVMGESSRHLRGDTMEDVIFNGSSARKPVGQASIELVFDNSDGAVGGQYAQYAEIAIRRQVSRDGQSKYFLNGAHCRRRDVVDLFLGTGLGPRSYAIIEQGMISRLIEAKPEELRVYLEEAAGISKYKERRRETENRIGHTRENISRLNDIREELEKQLNHLQRQARTAERYQTLKQEERRTRAELLALRWRAFSDEAVTREHDLNEQRNRLERATAELRGVEAAIEKNRERHRETSNSCSEVQARYYNLGGDISRVEQSIQHNKDLHGNQRQELEQVQQAWDEAQQHVTQDDARFEQLTTDIAALEPELGQTQVEMERHAAGLNDAERAMAVWQAQWEDLTVRLAEPGQIAQVESARIEHLKRQLEQLGQRLTKLDGEQSELTEDTLKSEIETTGGAAVESRAESERSQDRLREVLGSIEAARAHTDILGQQLDEARCGVQDLRGRLSSLDALQVATLGLREEAVHDWLQGCGLGNAPRLAQEVHAEPGWERAVETVLDAHLEAVCVENWSLVAGGLENLPQGRLALFDTSSRESATHAPVTLLSKVRAPWPLDCMLAGVYVARDLYQALARRYTLAPHESVITPDGVWIGKTWLRVHRGTNEAAGVLEREQEINGLRRALKVANGAVQEREDELNRNRVTLQELEALREQLQQECNLAHRNQTAAEARLNQGRSQLEQIVSRRQRLGEELHELQDQIARERIAHQQSIERHERAMREIGVLARERETLNDQREPLRSALDAARNRTQQQREASHRKALRMEALRTSHAAMQQGLERTEGQLRHLRERRERLQDMLQAGMAPLERLKQELKDLLERRIEVERDLSAARAGAQAIEAELREQDRQRLAVEQRIEELRTELDDLRMAWQEVSVRAQTLKEQFDETGFAAESLFDELPDGAVSEEWEQKLEALERRIARLGPINLAAIDEFKQHSERKEYLDRQHADLTEALETLEGAIRRIDRETRHRFKETFERVNQRLGATFPRLFGGGQAHLEMTGEDLLTTGVTIMARPPGKRLSNIHLMSGGEKALTAVAMVFAIFELNPAPFCLLDEVDAPLDEANVGRFCELVREMSERVQFVLITHNKTTMEYAHQLIGVTMHEPGVSRLVAVDIDAAAQMAAG